MVSPLADGDRDRAQLILVGSVAIALVIVGLVVVINTVLFTENVKTSESVDLSDSAAKFDFQVRRDTRSLLLRLNHEQRVIEQSTLRTRVDDNVTLFSRLLAESYGNSSNVWVDVSYDDSESTWGQRLVKGVDQPFTSPGGDDNWAVVRSVKAEDGSVSPSDDIEKVSIGRFVVNLDVKNTTQTPFSINVSAAEKHRNYTIQAKNPGANSKILIQLDTDHTSGFEETVECDPTRTRVLLDLKDGTSFTDDCSFSGYGEFRGPYNVTIINGTNGHGKFGLVVNRTVAEYQPTPRTTTSMVPYGPCKDAGDPDSAEEVCQSPALWAANVTFEYDSRAISYEQTKDLAIYP